MQNFNVLVLVLFFILNFTDSQAQFLFESRTLDITSNLPIEGANVLIKNTNKGAFTNLNGNFKIQIDVLPATLIITHLGYSVKEILITDDNKKNKPIYLDPLYNILNDVTVRPHDEKVSISNVQEYSIVDFEIFDEHIIRLERHGVRTNMLSLTDLNGNIVVTTKLEKIKKVERLFKSCNNNLYLVCSSYAIQLFVKKMKIDLGPKIQIDTFTTLIERCKLRVGDKLYYQVNLHNGLQKNISSYDLKSKEHNMFKSIANQTQLEAYFSDRGVINRSQTITNIHTNSKLQNKRIRDLQEDGDFYMTVLYKPEFPIYLSIDNEQIILFNHIEGKLQAFNAKDEIQSEVEVDYVNEKKWLKLVLIDQVSKKAFAIFNHKKGLSLEEINLKNGKTALKAVIESNNIQHQNMKMQNGYLFYLKTESSVRRNKELLKYKILE